MNFNFIRMLPKPLKLVCGHSDNQYHEELFKKWVTKKSGESLGSTS